MTVQVIRPTPRLVKPDPWPLDPGRVAPEGQWAWEGLELVVPMWEGGGAPNDVSLSNRSVSVTGTIPWIVSKFGPSRQFLANDRIQYTDFSGVDFTGPWSMTVTLRPTALPNNTFRRVFSITDSGGGDTSTDDVYVGIQGFLADLWELGTAADGSLVRNTSAELDVWTHVAVTYDGTNLRLYIDGVLDGSATHTEDFSALDSFAFGTVGGDAGQSEDYTYGALWSRRLSGNEIRQLARDPFAPFRPQYYRFFEEEAADDGTTTVTLTDSLAFNENLDRDFEGDRSVSDGLGFGEVLGADLTVERDLEQEALAFAENFTHNSVLGRQISDDLSLTEQLVIDRILTRLIEDSLGFAENLDRTVTKSGGAITRTITDTIAFAENLLRDVDLDRLMNENLTFSENLTVIVNDSPISQAVERHWRFQRFQNLRRERRWSDESDMWDS